MVEEIQPGLVRKSCLFCGATFWAARSDAKFCKKAHRQMYSRWRKRINLVANRADIDLQNLASYLDFADSRDTALVKLGELRQKIKNLVRERGIIIKEVK